MAFQMNCPQRHVYEVQHVEVDSPDTTYAGSYLNQLAAGISSLQCRSWNPHSLAIQYSRSPKQKIKLMKFATLSARITNSGLCTLKI